MKLQIRKLGFTLTLSVDPRLIVALILMLMS